MFLDLDLLQLIILQSYSVLLLDFKSHKVKFSSYYVDNLTMKKLILICICFTSLLANSQNLKGHNCDQFETPIKDSSSKTGWKCINQAEEMAKRRNALLRAGPNCDQFETPIKDSSSKTGWKCINQAEEMQKRDYSFCQPNNDLTECVTPDGQSYKLQKNVNQFERSIQKPQIPIQNNSNKQQNSSFKSIKE
jgi:hypothetical protein